MVALNYQTPDVPLRLNRAFFRRDGRCGFVLKPSYMRRIRSGLRSHGDVMPFFPRFVSPAPPLRAAPGATAISAIAVTPRVRAVSPAASGEPSSVVTGLGPEPSAVTGPESIVDGGRAAGDIAAPAADVALAVDCQHEGICTPGAASRVVHVAMVPETEPAPLSATAEPRTELPPLPGWLAGTEAALMSSGTLSVGRNSRALQRILRDSGRSSVVGIFGSRSSGGSLGRSQSLTPAVGRDGPTLPGLLSSQPLRSAPASPLATISEAAEAAGKAAAVGTAQADPVSVESSESSVVPADGRSPLVNAAATAAEARVSRTSALPASARAATPPSPGRTPRLAQAGLHASSSEQPLATSPSKIHGRSPFRQLAAAWLRGSRPGPSPLRRPLSALVLRAVSEGGSAYASPLLVQPQRSPDPFTLRLHVSDEAPDASPHPPLCTLAPLFSSGYGRAAPP